MNSHLYHLQININFKNVDFYKRLMEFLGWKVIFEGEDMIGFHSDKTGDLWFIDTDSKEISNYDNIGVNHLALRVEEQQNIDQAIEFLKQENIETLFGTPTNRPDFAASEDETYYQIIFETPDKLQVEIVYVGKKSI